MRITTNDDMCFSLSDSEDSFRCSIGAVTKDYIAFAKIMEA